VIEALSKENIALEIYKALLSYPKFMCYSFATHGISFMSFLMQEDYQPRRPQDKTAQLQLFHSPCTL